MERRRRLGNLLASPASKLLAYILDHFPLAWNDLERLGDVFAELRKLRRTAARTIERSRNDHPLARQMIWEWFARGLAACVRQNKRGRLARPGGSFLSCNHVLGGGGFKVFELKFHLIKELVATLRAATIELPPHLLDGEFEMGNKRFGARDMGRRTRSCSLGTGGLCLRVNARSALYSKQPVEAFQIIWQTVDRRCHNDK